jgi:hypothetical protein
MEALRQIYPEHSHQVLENFLDHADGDMILAMQLLELEYQDQPQGKPVCTVGVTDSRRATTCRS